MPSRPPRAGERIPGPRRVRSPVALRRAAARIDRILETRYGPLRRAHGANVMLARGEVRGRSQDVPRRRRDPLATLVRTILSQHTSDTNSDRAFDRLRARFASWEAVRDAPLRALAGAIRPAGLAAAKAPRIRNALRRIAAERGVLSLAFLRRWPLERARAWLLALHGVGPKTAAIVLVFGLGKPAFPVDTHVHRVGRRLGLIPERMSAEDAHPWMEEIVRPERRGPFHLLLIRHGRATCRARRPRCAACPVRALCRFYALGRGPAAAPSGTHSAGGLPSKRRPRPPAAESRLRAHAAG